MFRLPLMAMQDGNNVHISDFINLHTKHSKSPKAHNDSHMSDVRLTDDEKSASNKMITRYILFVI